MATTQAPWGFYGRQQELAQLRAYADWQVEYRAIAPAIPPEIAQALQAEGVYAQPLQQLLDQLAPAA